MKSFAILSVLATVAMATNHEIPVPVAPEHAPVAPIEHAPVAPIEHQAPPAHVAGAPIVHKVMVGGAVPGVDGADPTPILKYEPEHIRANIGDSVEFHFLAKNHTVTQSTFDEPCKKMDGGFDTEFQPNAEGRTDIIQTYLVETVEPLWFYCKQRTGNHCGKGMVFAINPAEVGDKTFEIWKGLAIQKNGTELEDAGIVENPPAPEPSTVSLAADGHAPVPTEVGHAQVAVGEGLWNDGSACSCQCLCGSGSFPAEVGVHNFGGWAGLMAM